MFEERITKLESVEHRNYKSVRNQNRAMPAAQQKALSYFI